MLPEAVIQALICPVCGHGFTPHERSLCCRSGHSFDVARQGYVSLFSGRRPTTPADTADMVAARSEFLGASHYQPIAEAVASATSEPAGADSPLVADVGAGTGHYLAHVLEQHPPSYGIALDLSRYALRRAARSHPRVAAVGADVWQGLPLRDGSVSVLLDVFAPRNAAEFQRVLRPDGVLVVVTPTPIHLAELVDTLDLLSVDERKEERVDETLRGRFEADVSRQLTFPMRLGHGAVQQLVRMGPSAHHIDPANLQKRLSGLPNPVEVTASVTVARYRPSP